jgi:hypothetical protein
MNSETSKIRAKNAFYIKLGLQGEFESECLTDPGFAKVGWTELPSTMLQGDPGQIDWEAVKILQNNLYKSKGTATNQTNQLKNFITSSPETLWITFFSNHLFWCFLDSTIEIREDKTKIRRTLDGWHHKNIQGEPLQFNRLSGSLLTLKSFRGTICTVHELPYLLRKINGETSPEEERAENAYIELIQSLQTIIHELHWKEFELLTDLIFRQAGWQRIGDLGKTQKSIDLELLSPITNESILIQVKSEAGLAEFEKFEKFASNQSASLYYFIVHKPSRSLMNASINSPVQTWFVEDIARLVVNYGLVDWLIAKAK